MRFLALLLLLAVGIWLGLHRSVREMLKKLWHYIKTPECTNVVITVATVVIAIWAGLQWWEMHGAGQQTKDLITAANSQARAADRFATSASNIETTIGQAEKDFQAMAGSSENSIKATQDAMRLEQRAWINVTARIPLEIKEDTGITGSAHIVNTGRTPAKNVSEQFVIERVKNGEAPTFLYPVSLATIVGTLFPNVTNDFRVDWIQPPPAAGMVKKQEPTILSRTDMLDFQSGRYFLVIYGRVNYKDVFEVISLGYSLYVVGCPPGSLHRQKVHRL